MRCIDEIKADMQRPQPMERLLCGDVAIGFDFVYSVEYPYSV